MKGITSFDILYIFRHSIIEVCGEGSHHDAVASVLDCDIVVNEFELKSRYLIHFRTNTLLKGMNLFMPELWIEWYRCFSFINIVKRPTKADMPLNRKTKTILFFSLPHF